MSAQHHLIRNARYFDGATLTGPATVQFDGNDFAGAFGADYHLQGAAEIDLGGDILFAGYVDLQVNGGDGRTGDFGGVGDEGRQEGSGAQAAMRLGHAPQAVTVRGRIKQDPIPAIDLQIDIARK